jgi:hypothetical protein
MPKGKAAKSKSTKKSHKDKSSPKGHKEGRNKKALKGQTDKRAKKTKKQASANAPASSAAKTKKAAGKTGTKGGQPKTPTSCAEHGVWTDIDQIQHPPANPKALEFSSVDPDENKTILSSGKMSFAMVGCSGDPKSGINTKAVAAAISADKDLSFFYHLGDMIYTISGSDTDVEVGAPVKQYSHKLWDDQLFGPYAKFPKKIFAIAGNHDGKYSEKIAALRDFFRFFCGNSVEPPSGSEHRRQMNQPYIYWSLDTPYAYIIGLYSNIANGGILDKPKDFTKSNFTKGPQYRWLVNELTNAGKLKQPNGKKKAVLLTVHYPPYSGATNFNVRGDQSQGGPVAKKKQPAKPNDYNVPYLAQALQQAFQDGGTRPHAIFSAHAHLFQRLNYKFADGRVMPCLVAGSGGHSPLEKLFKACDGSKAKKQKAPFDAVLPGSYQLPKGDSAQVKYYDDEKKDSLFGYLKVTIDAKKQTLQCDLIGVTKGGTKKLDSSKPIPI